jgi:hypothetical protein
MLVLGGSRVAFGHVRAVSSLCRPATRIQRGFLLSQSYFTWLPIPILQFPRSLKSSYVRDSGCRQCGDELICSSADDGVSKMYKDWIALPFVDQHPHASEVFECLLQMIQDGTCTPWRENTVWPPEFMAPQSMQPNFDA